VDVDLVTLRVTVTDDQGNPFTGLKADNFRVFDNDIEQAIRHFSVEDRPFTMGLVLDRSGSMIMMIDDVYQAAFHTIRASKSEDEFFILTFDDRLDLRQDFSMNRQLLQKQLKGVTARGSTALWDAVAAGLEKVRKGSHEKKALLVVTDGEDNRSYLSFGDLLERARQEEIAIYTVGLFERSEWSPVSFLSGLLGRAPQQRGGPSRGNRLSITLLTELAEATGGRAYFPSTMAECDQVCIAIAQELRQQYEVGYYPQPKLAEGGWRSVQVQLQLPADLSGKGLMARARPGYFAPRDQHANLSKH
jgi:Ca-activated chloride channel family protein